MTCYSLFSFLHLQYRVAHFDPNARMPVMPVGYRLFLGMFSVRLVILSFTFLFLKERVELVELRHWGYIHKQTTPGDANRTSPATCGNTGPSPPPTSPLCRQGGHSPADRHLQNTGTKLAPASPCVAVVTGRRPGGTGRHPADTRHGCRACNKNTPPLFKPAKNKRAL